MDTTTFTSSELMTINAARLLRDGDVVFVGVGIPNLACNLARRTHAPNLYMIYEAGVIGARPSRLPLSIGDPTLVSGAAAVCSMYDIFTLYLQRGNVDVGFLGGAQIDQFGNINATVIGLYYLAFFTANALVGWIGGFYETMRTTEFWLLHAGLAAGAGVVFVLFKLFMARRLAA